MSNGNMFVCNVISFIINVCNAYDVFSNDNENVCEHASLQFNQIHLKCRTALSEKKTHKRNTYNYEQ